MYVRNPCQAQIFTGDAPACGTSDNDNQGGRTLQATASKQGPSSSMIMITITMNHYRYHHHHPHTPSIQRNMVSACNIFLASVYPGVALQRETGGTSRDAVNKRGWMQPPRGVAWADFIFSETFSRFIFRFLLFFVSRRVACPVDFNFSEKYVGLLFSPTLYLYYCRLQRKSYGSDTTGRSTTNKNTKHPSTPATHSKTR